MWNSITWWVISINPQNSNSAKHDSEKNLKNLYYSSQNSKYLSKTGAWYMLELDSLKLKETHIKWATMPYQGLIAYETKYQSDRQ